MKKLVICRRCLGYGNITEFSHKEKTAKSIPCPDCNGKGVVGVEEKPKK